MLTESHPQPIPAPSPTAAPSAPPVGTHPSAVVLGLVCGGLDKTVSVSDISAVCLPGHQVLPIDLGDLSLTELVLTMHKSAESHRGLQQKERVVEDSAGGSARAGGAAGGVGPPEAAERRAEVSRRRPGTLRTSAGCSCRSGKRASPGAVTGAGRVRAMQWRRSA
jgi:hypothetical protein